MEHLRRCETCDVSGQLTKFGSGVMGGMRWERVRPTFDLVIIASHNVLFVQLPEMAENMRCGAYRRVSGGILLGKVPFTIITKIGF